MRVFLSHSSEDKEFVETLAKDILKLDINVWLDKWEIKVGDSITEKINEGLSASDFLILIMSPNSMVSQWVKRELSSALITEINAKKIKVLPVLLKDCELPPLLQDKLFADFRNDKYDSGFNALKNTLIYYYNKENLKPKTDLKLCIEDVEVLNCEDRSKLGLDITLSNYGFDDIWIKNAIITSKTRSFYSGFMPSPYIVKAIYRIKIPYEFKCSESFLTKTFEGTETEFSKKGSGSYGSLRADGIEKYYVKFNVPVYFKCSLKDKLCLRLIFERPEKYKEDINESEINREIEFDILRDYRNYRDYFDIRLITSDKKEITFKKPEIAQEFIFNLL